MKPHALAVTGNAPPPRQISPLLLGLLLLPGCPSDPPGNPGVLWLAPDMAETRVKLVDHEPDPF